nr:reverse transcriptase domain-containing protein [Tanacetum cinerariifolium]
MTTLVEKQNHVKFYEFHGEVGHNTDECMHLKKHIEEMLKAGKLSHLIKELKQNNKKEQPKAAKKGLSSPHNEIIGRPGVRKLQAVSSTTHGMLKISIEGGVITLKGSRMIPLECAMVRQKKRRQAADRNQAIQEEVGKLVNAGIMKEVDYHDWLSNLVMVKNHDDSWRMATIKSKWQKKMKKNSVHYKPRNILLYKDAFRSEKRQSNLTASGGQSVSQADWQKPRKAKEAFKQMKQQTNKLSMLVAPMDKEELIVYLAAAKETVLSRPKIARTLQKWSIESGEYTINYRPRVSVKGHILADFIVERPKEDSLDTLMEIEEEIPEPWFGTINNEAKYEALIAELRIAEQVGVKNLQANVDSRLVANQVSETYVTKEADIIRYLEKVRILASGFKAFSIRQVPRSENKKADALSKIASTSFSYLSKQVLVKELKEKSKSKAEVPTLVEKEVTWMTPIFEYLTEGTLPADVKKAREVRRKSQRFVVINGILYKTMATMYRPTSSKLWDSLQNHGYDVWPKP